MRTKNILPALGMILASSLQAQDWTSELVTLNPEVIDSVKQISEPGRWYNHYMIYYHQPLQHEQPELGTLPLRAMMSVYRHGGDISTMMNQMFINGYELNEDVIENPEYNLEDYFHRSVGELQGRYDGNLLQPEHRYFGKSHPDNPWETLGYCEAKEAAADFHALIEAMKKVFKGKWAITGASKGGVATAIQHAYYPDDADCFVPYVAPFMFSEHDNHMLDYMMTESWTPELREEVLSIQKKMLYSPSLFKLFCFGQDLTGDALDETRCEFLLKVCGFDHDVHRLVERDIVSAMLDENHAYLKSKELDDYTDEMLLYMIAKSRFYLGSQGSDFERWNNPQYNARACASEFQLPVSSVFSLKESSWKDHYTPNNYQQKHELGYYDLNFEYFYGTQQEVDSVTTLWRNTAQNMLSIGTGKLYDSVEFDPSLMQFVCQQTANAQKPILFIYGSDDLWTGARMPEQYINNKNVREYILSGMCHNACIYELKDAALQDEIWAFLDDVFKNQTVAITQINQPSAVKTRYNLLGQPSTNTHGLGIENGHITFRK